ncbi:MAG: hypothetical protein ABEJ80_04280 [Halarchaeum sp.]
MNRRSFLGATGLFGLSAGSGCFEPFPYLDSTLRVPWIGIDNETKERQTVDIRVKRDRQVVHESTHVVEAETRTNVECAWGGDEGVYALSGRGPGGEWEWLDVASRFEELPDCAVVTLECYRSRDGFIGFSLFARAFCDSYESECTAPTANGSERGPRERFRGRRDTQRER